MTEAFVTHRIEIDPATSVQDPDALLLREWLLTNGTGAYSAGTAAGCNTRRYHGLLIAAGALPETNPPVGRVVALNQVWEQLQLHHESDAGGEPAQLLDFPAFVFRDGDGGRTFAPTGHAMLVRLERGLSVRWTYRWGPVTFERELFLHWKQQAVTLRYRVRGLQSAHMRATLRLHPMLTLRDFHALHGTQNASQFHFTASGDQLTAHSAYRADPAVTLQCAGARFEPGPHMWNDAWYPAETERGQDDQENLFVPGAFVVEVEDEAPVHLTAALGSEPVAPAADASKRAAHLQPMAQRLAEGTDAPALASVLAIAADDFVVDRTILGEDLSTILAGYPWFADWGRDTFIALPGLLLETGRHDEALRTLRTFADAIQEGLVPNRFDDYDAAAAAAHYNTVDASLWFVHAALAYVDATGDAENWQAWLAASCLRIVDAYTVGTAHGIRMDVDGLITAGDPQTQLTWMDARCGDVTFTPRYGKAVEINALWHRALAGLARALPRDERFEGPRATCSKLAARAKRAFAPSFWNEAQECLFDVLVPDGAGAFHPDASMRPNQIFAVSLPDSPLPAAKQKAVVEAVRQHLLTPVGLRTLPTWDGRYRGRYTADQFCRDGAYHQGTIWPWLIGPYAEAVLRAGRHSKKAKAQAMEAIMPLLHQLTGAQPPVSLGQLHEIYEGDPVLPAELVTGGHRPVGCFAQAWSVAEVLRVWRQIAAK